MLTFNQYLSEAKNGFSGTVYHGSGYRFSEFKQSKARIPNDFYGGGVAYFTSDFNVAITYAKSMAKKSSSDPLIYTVDIRIRNLFDVDDKFTGTNLIKILPKETEQFARGAGLLGLGADKYSILGSLQAGKVTLSGDQVFKGLSMGMNTTAKAREHLIANGYDGLRYNGGVNMGMAIKHDVYLIYNANNAKIVKRQIIKRK